jgi:hypothetical protein
MSSTQSSEEMVAALNKQQHAAATCVFESQQLQNKINFKKTELQYEKRKLELQQQRKELELDLEMQSARDIAELQERKDLFDFELQRIQSANNTSNEFVKTVSRQSDSHSSSSHSNDGSGVVRFQSAKRVSKAGREKNLTVVEKVDKYNRKLSSRLQKLFTENNCSSAESRLTRKALGIINSAKKKYYLVKESSTTADVHAKLALGNFHIEPEATSDSSEH